MRETASAHGGLDALYFLMGSTQAAWFPFAALFLSSRGLGASAIGLALGLMAFATFLSAPAWGFLADRFSPVVIFRIMTAMAVPLAVLLFAVHGSPALLLVSAGMAACATPLIGIANAIALARLDSSETRHFGSVRLWLAAGYALFATVWGIVAQETTTTVVPLLYAALLLVTAISMQAVESDKHDRPSANTTAAIARAHGAMPSLVPFGLFLFSLFLLQAGFSTTRSFLALRIVSLGGNVLFVGMSNSLQALVEVPVMAWMARARAKFRPVRLFSLGCMLWILIFVTWAMVPDAIVVTVVAAFGGIAFSLTTVTTVVIIDELVPRRLRATGQSLGRAVGSGLAPALGLAVGGFVYGDLGPAAMFGLAAVAVGGAAACTWVLRLNSSPTCAGQAPDLSGLESERVQAARIGRALSERHS